ncbi:MAG: thioredoxin [Thermodesulfobacteriota bacterium]
MKGSRPAFFLAASAAAGILALGIYRREFGETLLNAVLICLSCIGIG